MRTMPTLSTVLLSVSASAIQIRLLYANGNANENRLFYHDANQQIPSLVPITPCPSPRGVASTNALFVKRKHIIATHSQVPADNVRRSEPSRSASDVVNQRYRRLLRDHRLHALVILLHHSIPSTVATLTQTKSSRST